MIMNGRKTASIVARHPPDISFPFFYFQMSNQDFRFNLRNLYLHILEKHLK